jgi:hypothetical protein
MPSVSQTLRSLLFALPFCLLLGWSVASSAPPVKVKFQVVGSPGGWVLNFKVTNQIGRAPADMAIKTFGVLIDDSVVIAAPQGFLVDRYESWYHAGAGGSDTEYNVSWQSLSNDLVPSSERAGFVVYSTDVAPPTSVRWFVLAGSASAGEYLGEGHFGSDALPGFEGIAMHMPEPGSYALFGLGLAALAWARRRASINAA